MEQDPYARIRAECAVSNTILFVSARFSAQAKVDIPYVARKVLNQVGYVEQDFDAKSVAVLTSLQEFPPDELTIFREKELTRRADRKTAGAAPGDGFRFCLQPYQGPDAAADLAGT